MRNINTKKFTALFLACLLAASSLTACGSDASSGNAGAAGNNSGAQDEKADSSKTGQSSEKAQDNDGAQDAGTDASSEEQQTAGGDGYLSYDDLPNEQSFFLWLDEGDIHFKCNYPDNFAFDGHGNGMGSENSFDYSIVMAHSEQPMPDTSLEDAFYALLNGEDGFHSILRMVKKASYDDLTPDETESVTLDCGREALRFSGLQHMDDYGTIADCPIYGYCTMLDDIPVIICYIIFDEENYEEDRLAGRERYHSPDELDHYIEEMLNTLRVIEE